MDIGTDALLNAHEGVIKIEEGVWLLESLKDIEKVPVSSAVRMEYNSIVHCQKGEVILEIGGEKQVCVQSGQLLLLPADRLLHPVLISPDVEVIAIIISDDMLRTVLGPQIGIWNRAMYMKKSYVVNVEGWTSMLRDQVRTIKNDNLVLKHEITMSFLRFMLLFICEQLLIKERVARGGEDLSSDRDKIVFNQFLTLIDEAQQKRHRVSYYAEQLNVTPKYLSTICTRVSGKPPINWIMNAVMEQCYMMLKTTSLSVKEISNKMGFPNPSYFGQYFREEAGMTPLEFRRGKKNSG